MAVPDIACDYHTAWVRLAGDSAASRAVSVRYTLAGGALVMFGDEELSTMADGAHVIVTIHEIYDGPPLASFAATLCDVAPADVDAAALEELLAHVSLGHDLAEVDGHLREIRAHRRVVVLVT